MPEASGSDVADESDYSVFENKTGLGEDMKFLASMPELCDVTFLVGDTKEPICAVKAVLTARSRVFQKIFEQAPSPQRKKEPMKENKFRTFLKRSSEPLLNLQNVAQQRSGYAQQLAPIQEPNQHHTLIIEEFEPDVFRQLIEYIHTGCVTLQPRTLLGLMNAADYYGLEQLRKACTGFVQCCITVDTVCALLSSAERYIQYKCTKSLVQKVLEFVNEHGNEVLTLGSFTLLPEHVVRLILAREELQADEFTKFQAALMWSKKYCDSIIDQSPSVIKPPLLEDVIGNFLEYIQFHKIPATVLMNEIHPLKLVPGETIMTALAYQADPSSVDADKLSPYRVKHQDRSLSVQSSLQDQHESNTSLSSTVEGSDERQHSGKHSVTAEQEIREQQQWNRKQRGSEDEDLQRLIEQRTQFQTMRQEEELQRQHEELQATKQEEELRKQEMQEEFDRRQKEQQRRRKREEEEKRKQEEVELRIVLDEEEAKRQRQEEVLMKQLQLEEEVQKIEEQQRREAFEKLRQDQLMEQRQRSLEEVQQEDEIQIRQEDETKIRQEDEMKARQEEDTGKQDEDLGQDSQKKELQMPEEVLQQQEKEEREGETSIDQQEDKKQEAEGEPVEPEVIGNKKQIQSEEATREEESQEKVDTQIEQEELLISQQDEEQRRLREERKLQLQLQQLKIQWSLEQDMLQAQEEVLRQQIEERRYEERAESLQFPQLQLQLEGRKPEPEKAEKRQKDRKKSRKRKRERVEIRVHEAESPKQETAPAEGVTGLYIKLVVRQEGRAPLVWLFKTHKF